MIYYRFFSILINKKMNKSIMCGSIHSVALKEDGTIECWEIIHIINVIQFIKLLLV